MLPDNQVKTGAWTFGKMSEADTPYLYHYRSGKSLKSMFDREGLLFRFTRSDIFKDKMEGKAVYAFYGNTVEELFSEGKITKEQYNRIKGIHPPGMMITHERKTGRDWYVRQEFEPFILCFSTEEDDPALYKLIKAKESGLYYLSMDTTVVRSIKRLGARNGVHISFGRILYGNDIGEHIRNSIVEMIKTPFLFNGAEAYLRSYLHSLQFMAKESRYESEKEVRIVINVPSPLREPLPDFIFDEKREYLTIKVPKSYVNSIVPKEDNDKSLDGELFVELARRGYPQAERIS